MGNTQSTRRIDRIDREETKRPSMGRRKLSKPRVGNHSTRGDCSIPCLPPAPSIVSGRVLKSENGGITQETDRAKPRQRPVSASGISTSKDGMVSVIGGSCRTRRPSLPHQQLPSASHSRNPSLTGSYRDYPLPLSRYNSRRNSTVTSHNVNVNPMPETIGLDQSHHLPSIMRRRSQILAAPPATRTRRQPTLILEGGMPAPQLLALDLADADGTRTPSGYSVLGGFKRGSLRIMNATASPIPTPQDARPKRRNTSPAHPKTPMSSVLMPTSQQSTHESHVNEDYFEYPGSLSVPNDVLLDYTRSPGGQETDTPMSFRTAPEGVFCFSDDFKKPSTPGFSKTPKCEVDSSSMSRAAGESTEQPIFRNASTSSKLRSNLSEVEDTVASHVYNKPAHRPSVKSTTDSGYCSTGSIRSLESRSGKASDGDLQHGGEGTNPELAKLGTHTEFPQPQLLNPNSKIASRTITGALQDEGFTKCTDKYRLDATKEGPIVEISRRTRKLSLSMGTRFFR